MSCQTHKKEISSPSAWKAAFPCRPAAVLQGEMGAELELSPPLQCSSQSAPQECTPLSFSPERCSQPPAGQLCMQAGCRMHDIWSAFNCSARAATLLSSRHLPSGHNLAQKGSVFTGNFQLSEEHVSKKCLNKRTYATTSGSSDTSATFADQMGLEYLKLEAQRLWIPAPRPTEDHPTPDYL